MSPEVKEIILEFLENIIKNVSPKATAEILKEGDQWRIYINSNGSAVFTEEKNEVLRAIQHILRVLVHKKFPEDRTHFIIDVDNYKITRENKIKNEIPLLAKNKVLEGGKTLVLLGLSSYERMIIHKLLAEINGLETNSVGFGDSRKLLIRPTSEFGATGIDDSIIWSL